jgi:SAM-dependent methyltransferase
VIQDHAEAVPFDDAAFDLVAAATAIHWFDLGVVLPKLHRALRPGGHLAGWRNTFGDPLAARTVFRERIDELIARRTDAPRRPVPGGVDTDYWAGRLAAGRLFEKVHTADFRWVIDLTADQAYGLFSTFSNWTSDEAAAAAQIVRDLGGRVTEPYMTPLIVMQRVSLT